MCKKEAKMCKIVYKIVCKTKTLRSCKNNSYGRCPERPNFLHLWNFCFIAILGIKDL